MKIFAKKVQPLSQRGMNIVPKISEGVLLLSPPLHTAGCVLCDRSEVPTPGESSEIPDFSLFDMKCISVNQKGVLKMRLMG